MERTENKQNQINMRFESWQLEAKSRPALYGEVSKQFVGLQQQSPITNEGSSREVILTRNGPATDESDAELAGGCGGSG
jgi:hypothetical protein